jgi:peptidoglycan/xylan/chitin deacetylase (PgdA/CDA1 family)
VNYSRHLIENGVAIFLLHGVEDGVQTEVRNYTRKHIPRADFIAFVKDLTEHGVAVSIDDIVANRHDEAPLPPYAFAITFDDGFENNLTVAAQILDDMAIPATFYLTTDFIDRNRMSWIDRIEFVVEQATSGHLSLPWGERHFSDVEGRKAALDDIRKNVKNNPALDPEEIASSVQDQLGFAETWSSEHPLDKKLTWAQVKQLASGPGFTIGGHSHSHSILAFLDDNALETEIDLFNLFRILVA